MAYQAADDGDCWSQALAGDRSGLAVFAATGTPPPSTTTATQRLGDQADRSKTSTAEVFIVALRTGHRVQPHPDAGLRPWLLAVANNLLRRHARARAVAGRAYRRLRLEREELPDIAESVAETSADAYYLAILRDVLSALPVSDRELIQLCVLQGIAPGVVADITGIRPATVRSRLSRALARARRAVERDEKSLAGSSDSHPPSPALIPTTHLGLERGI